MKRQRPVSLGVTVSCALQRQRCTSRFSFADRDKFRSGELTPVGSAPRATLMRGPREIPIHRTQSFRLHRITKVNLCSPENGYARTSPTQSSIAKTSPNLSPRRRRNARCHAVDRSATNRTKRGYGRCPARHANAKAHAKRSHRRRRRHEHEGLGSLVHSALPLRATAPDPRAYHVIGKRAFERVWCVSCVEVVSG